MNSLRVGFFLALRQLKRSSKWTTGLIVFIMTLTFLNLVVVGGILVGLIEGSGRAYRTQFSSDVFIKNPAEKSAIQQTSAIVMTAQSNPHVQAITTRYTSIAKIEANYKQKRANKREDFAGGYVVGINPQKEDEVTHLASLVVKGSYLANNDDDSILLGTLLTYEYTKDFGEGLEVLDHAEIGDKVRLSIGKVQKEYTIKGLIKSKIGEVSMRVYMRDRELRRLLNRPDFNAQEIAIKLTPDGNPETVVHDLKQRFSEDNAIIQTWQESQGKFFKDIAMTFNSLGIMIGGIGLVVASITIFIVVFINAITRRKFIGILKGIGINGRAIEISYILQSMFYAVLGSGIGLLIVYVALKPYFDAHPINFPFSDGILVAPITGTLQRAGILFLTTLLAGYIPARMIIKRNTLDAILGR